MNERWRRRAFAGTFLSAAVWAALALPALAQESPEDAARQKLHAEAIQLLEARDLEKAEEAYQALLEKYPDDSIGFYNLACARALGGRGDAAMESLNRAVEKGYVDGFHMTVDPDLTALRERPDFRALAERLEKRANDPEIRLPEVKGKLGDLATDCRIEIVGPFILAANVDEETFDRLKKVLNDYPQAMWKHLFTDRKPNYLIPVYVLDRDADYKKLGGKTGAAGFYDPNTRSLTISMETGTGTLVHELTHALHFADQGYDRHPQWMIEGLGSLYEAVTIRGDRAVGFINWRLPHLQRVLGKPGYIPWKRLFGNEPNVFRDDELAGLAYAEARYLMFYLQEMGALERFYRLYKDNFAKEKTGTLALELAVGLPADKIEAHWQEWCVGLIPGKQPPVPRPDGGKSGVSLGVRVFDEDGKLEVTDVTPDGPADRAGVLEGDILLEFDTTVLTDFTKLQEVLIRTERGSAARLVVERNGRTRSLTLEFEP